MAVSLNETQLLAAWLVALVAAAVAMHSFATYRLSARPAVTLRISQIAAGVATVTLAGLVVWGLIMLAR